MLLQTSVSDLLVDLSTEKQQFLAGGCRYYGRSEEPTQGSSPVESSPETPSQSPSPVIASQPILRLAVGSIITVTPFAFCLPGQSCGGGEGSQTQD
ncbi:hypothetical protein IQ244_04545 [Nostoc sp. LEGE 06077]|uniref:hypothetical protein n=1 Tax=Nostoc sp. LEGE 06077 TaxID=915325 RepID=UPI00188231A6|nr:hypothetical protein [Nostoc sp. LEGE 06077]MBE9205791.1 hypothetical protein [Nostoc sp. LEGE 06077]